MKKIKCAVIGCGAIGTTHADRYSKSARAELAAVVDILPDRAEALAAKHKVPVDCIGIYPELTSDTCQRFDPTPRRWGRDRFARTVRSGR